MDSVIAGAHAATQIVFDRSGAFDPILDRTGRQFEQRSVYEDARFLEVASACGKIDINGTTFATGINKRPTDGLDGLPCPEGETPQPPLDAMTKKVHEALEHLKAAASAEQEEAAALGASIAAHRKQAAEHIDSRREDIREKELKQDEDFISRMKALHEAHGKGIDIQALRRDGVILLEQAKQGSHESTDTQEHDKESTGSALASPG